MVERDVPQNLTDTPSASVHPTPRPRWIFVFLSAAFLIRIGSDVARAFRHQDIMSDDAYYYMIVARNFAETGQMTFDGLSKTNGYHPLLFWVEVLIYWAGAARLSVPNQAITIILFQTLVVIATVALILRWVWRYWPTQPATALTVLIALTFLIYTKHVRIVAAGMESTLVFPALVVFLYFLWRSRWTAAGFAALLLVMARLDTLVYILFPVLLIQAIRAYPNGRIVFKRSIQIAGPAAVGIILLMAAYQVAFGHPMPISGACKSSFPIPHVQFHLLTIPFHEALRLGKLEARASINVFTAPFLLIAAGIILFRTGHLPAAPRSAALLFVLLGGIQLAAFVLFQKWAKPIPMWYLAPLLIFTSGALAAACVHLLGIRRAQFVGLLIAVLMVPAAVFREVRFPVKSETVAKVGGFGDFVSQQPDGTLWAWTDCGKMSFWLDVPFVNLDGLVNSFEYQEALRDQKLGEYLKDANVRYLVVTIWQKPRGYFFEPMYAHRTAPDVFAQDYDTYEFYIYSYMYETYSDKILLHPDQEVWRSAPHTDGIDPEIMVVYDLKKTPLTHRQGS